MAEPAVPTTDRRAALLRSFALWTLLGLTSTASMLLNGLSEGMPGDWRRTLAWNLPNFWLWMLLAPWIVRLARPRAGATAARTLALHLPLSLAVAGAQTAAALMLYWITRGSQATEMPTLGSVFRMRFIYQYHLALVTYWVILAIGRGMDSARRLHAERLRSAQLEGQLASSRLEALRSQLQPHFLFNTLNAVSALVLSDPAQARTMIARLGEMLRLSLEESDAPSIPLARELALLDGYLAIQRVRFQDRLRIRMDIAPDTLQAAVPQLILQPLVENALRHGLLPEQAGGTLTVRARRHADRLRLEVSDDGRGLPAGGVREGIGLGNTRARLAALGSGTLRLEARPEGGTRVEVELPWPGMELPA